MRKLLLAFIIGSALPSVIVSNLYIGLANSSKDVIKRYEFFPLMISLFIGISNAVNYKLYEKYQSEIIPVLVGAIFGIMLSIIGRFIFDLPKRLFLFTKENEWTVHIYAAITYAIIFYMIIHTMNKWFLY